MLPADAVVKNIPYNEELDTRTNKPMQSYGENPNTHEGTRGMGSTFRIGEEWPEPTCEGYEFLGWKLRLTPWFGNPTYSEKLYQHNEVLTFLRKIMNLPQTVTFQCLYGLVRWDINLLHSGKKSIRKR